jgi:hypothetical protein
MTSTPIPASNGDFCIRPWGFWSFMFKIFTKMWIRCIKFLLYA